MIETVEGYVPRIALTAGHQYHFGIYLSDSVNYRYSYSGDDRLLVFDGMIVNIPEFLSLFLTVKGRVRVKLKYDTKALIYCNQAEFFSE